MSQPTAPQFERITLDEDWYDDGDWAVLAIEPHDGAVCKGFSGHAFKCTRPLGHPGRHAATCGPAALGARFAAEVWT